MNAYTSNIIPDINSSMSKQFVFIVLRIEIGMLYDEGFYAFF